ncbi:MAG: CRTAC1 family protein [Acidobacteriia bacterium]|nr:CRTAC1 family protein [Terriglobia bacterium]
MSSVKLELLSLLLLAFAASQNKPAPPVFTDVTKQAGISFKHCLGDDEISSIVEATGSGCAFLDFDGDGLMDIYAVNGRYLEGISDPDSRFKSARTPSRLYRNKGDGTFEDVTEKAGVGASGYGMGVAVGDFDNDGHPDIYVTNFGKNILYHNNGNSTFTDVTEKAGVACGQWSVGAIWIDYDKDGYLDLFVGNYLEFDSKYRLFYEAEVYPGPLSYPGQLSVLYHNNHDGTFTDVSAKAGINKKGRAMGVLSADYDEDGWPDIFVANDAMQNYMYHNNGNGTFTEVGIECGAAFGQHGNAVSSMGGDFADFDGDGKLDLVVPAMNYIGIFRNLGRGLFEEISVSTGVARVSAQFWSWGGDFMDFDNDGWPDLLIANGDGHRLSEKQEQLLMRNVAGPNGQRVFVDVSRSVGPYFDTRSVARGLATGDCDNDGDLDFFVLNIDQPSVLLRNDGGNRNNWLTLQLIGTKSNRDGVGARVIVRSGDFTQVAEKMSASSYLSQNDPRLHFGLGQRTMVDEVTIQWPSGKTQKLKEVKANQFLKVIEP